MTHRYSTALSYIALAGTSVFCLHSKNYKLDILPTVGYGLLIVQSILGIWKWGNPSHGMLSETSYRWAKLLMTIFTFPCFVGQLYAVHGYSERHAFGHPGVSLFPLFLHLKDDYVRDDLVDGIISLNVISGAVISIMKGNYWGLAAVFSFGFQYFALAKSYNLDIPTVDLCNYAFCFVCFFALRAFDG